MRRVWAGGRPSHAIHRRGSMKASVLTGQAGSEQDAGHASLHLLNPMHSTGATHLQPTAGSLSAKYPRVPFHLQKQAASPDAQGYAEERTAAAATVAAAVGRAAGAVVLAAQAGSCTLRLVLLGRVMFEKAGEHLGLGRAARSGRRAVGASPAAAASTASSKRTTSARCSIAAVPEGRQLAGGSPLLLCSLQPALRVGNSMPGGYGADGGRETLVTVRAGRGPSQLA